MTTEETLTITEPQAQTQEQPAQAHACDKAAPKKKRRVLTLDEREALARQKAANAAQELATIRKRRAEESLHRKACIGEIVIALAARDGGAILDAILNGAAKRSVPIDDHHMAIIQALYPPAPPTGQTAQNA